MFVRSSLGRARRQRVASSRWFALAAVALGTSYAFLPLFSSNQNHHFLIGIAHAGEGWLADDWLVSTADPFPVFSTYVTLVHRYLADWVHYIVYYALFGAYGYGLLRIVERVYPTPSGTARAARLAFVAALCLLHNEVLGYLLGVDLAHMPWFQMTHWGVAEQEIFGHSAFQASSFGMLLPLAIAMALEGRSYLATSIAASVLLVHFSYALTAGALTAAFMLVEFRRTGQLKRPIVVGAIGLAFAVPIAADVLIRLGPTSADASRAAASILVRHLPQETVVAYWFGWKAAAQVVLMLAGITLAAGSDLFPILVAPFAAGLALTLAQIATGSPQLALLFPWRVSVLLVPIATALVVWRGVTALAARMLLTQQSGPARQRILVAVSLAAIVVSMTMGAVRMALHFSYYYGENRASRAADRIVPARWRSDFAQKLGVETLPMMHFVRETATHGDLYVIPPELERFRLVAGAPVLADLKSHPYKDVEVLEWRRRLDLTMALYASHGDCHVLSILTAAYRVTDVVADHRIGSLQCPGWIKTYGDPVFAIYQAPRAEMLK